MPKTQINEKVFNELVKNGYSQQTDGRKIWNIANRSFLYMTDELAEKFLEFRSFPRYKKTIVEIETALIKEHAKKNLTELEKTQFNLVDMGCGDGSKAKVLIESLPDTTRMCFCPVHVNSYLVELATKNVKKAGYAKVTGYNPHVSDLKSFGEIASLVRGGECQTNVILLLGSILASYDIHDYLFQLTRSMLPGDYLLIGNSIRSGERFANLQIYQNTLFEEWFRLILQQLDLKHEDFKYDARFANGRVEGYFTAKKNVTLSHQGKKVLINKGDEIITGILYKYYARELEEFCRMYFRDVKIETDSESEYALIFCKK